VPAWPYGIFLQGASLCNPWHSTGAYSSTISWQKCNFSEKAGEWACIWVDRFLRCYPDWSQHQEKAIAAFAGYLSRKKPATIVSLTLRYVQLFIAFCDVGPAEEAKRLATRSEENSAISNPLAISTSALSGNNPMAQNFSHKISPRFFGEI